jgi:hypothetical protein
VFERPIGYIKLSFGTRNISEKVYYATAFSKEGICEREDEI